MAKTYLTILSERGITPFIGVERFEELHKFDPKTEYAMPDPMQIAFRSPNQHKIELGKTTNLIGDMCWYGASEEELFGAIKHGMVVIDALKHNLNWKKSAEDNDIQVLYKKYRRFQRRVPLTEREKLVITAYTGYTLDGTFGKVTPFVEEVFGHSIRTAETPVVLEVHKTLKDEFCEICRKHRIFEYR